jgi:squalene-hopene/tetraprenyl-beta-curcumene cyclase
MRYVLFLTFAIGLVAAPKSPQARGAKFLLRKQANDGSWVAHPAITALCIMAIHDSGVDAKADVNRGLSYVLSFRQKNGAIYPASRDMKSSANYPNYTTAVSLLMLAALDRPEHHDIMRAARSYLQDSQFADSAKIDYGGIGYGKTGRADLSNGSWAAEALAATAYLDGEGSARADTMWRNLSSFLSKCQNLPETNKADFVSTHPDDRGGFFYRPLESKAGEREGEHSGLISSGSMTYAGLKSMLHAKLDRRDPRVKGALRYLSGHWTVDENPGMGPQGLFYYLHIMTKALATLGDATFADKAGVVHDWRKEVRSKLLGMQAKDGSWANTHGRYMESMPELATSYALITLARLEE